MDSLERTPSTMQKRFRTLFLELYYRKGREGYQSYCKNHSTFRAKYLGSPSDEI